MNSIAQARIERKINWAGIAVMVGLVANLCAGSWFASSLSSRVNSLEVASIKRDGDHELLVRMDERTRVMAAEIGEIKKRLSAR